VSYYASFILEGLPKTTNGSHGSWRAAAAERKRWRQAAHMAAKSYNLIPDKPLEQACIKCVRHSSVEPDYDNLSISFKSVIDGLKDAGVIADDKSTVIISREYLWQKAPRSKGWIRVEVRSPDYKLERPCQE
jgi:Holliday junction resolvase RusA-like endonuclease